MPYRFCESCEGTGFFNGTCQKCEGLGHIWVEPLKAQAWRQGFNEWLNQLERDKEINQPMPDPSVEEMQEANCMCLIRKGGK